MISRSRGVDWWDSGAAVRYPPSAIRCPMGGIPESKETFRRSDGQTSDVPPVIPDGIPESKETFRRSDVRLQMSHRSFRTVFPKAKGDF